MFYVWGTCVPHRKIIISIMFEFCVRLHAQCFVVFILMNLVNSISKTRLD